MGLFHMGVKSRMNLPKTLYLGGWKFYMKKITVFLLTITCLIGTENIYAGITAKASSQERTDVSAQKAVDGNKGSRWSSGFADNQWLEINLGEKKELIGLKLYWEAAFGKKYDVLASGDGKNWQKIFSQDNGTGGTEDIDFDKISVRHIKLVLKERGTGYGFSLHEVIFKTEDEPFGIGEKDADFILRKGVDFLKRPQRKIFIPKSWKGNNVILLLSASASDYDFYVNGKPVSEVRASKYPAKIDISKYVKYSSFNTFSAKYRSNSGKSNVFKLMMIFKNSALEGLNKIKKSDPKGYFLIFAELYSEGYFPLWLNNKQDYWTVVGTEESYEESLVSSKGIINSYSDGFSLMPFLYVDNGLVTFRDVNIENSLEEGYIPIPTVKWEYKETEFIQTVFDYVENKKSSTYIYYKLINRGKKTLKGKLFLAVRPFDVCPPWMHGGLTRIDSIESSSDNKIITINKNRGIVSVVKPDGFGAAGYYEDDIILGMNEGRVPSEKSVSDSSGYISAVLEYEFDILPGEEREYCFLLPLDEDMDKVKIPDKNGFLKNYESTKKKWKNRLNKIEINIPDKQLLDTFRANIAYILINKDGPALQPGSRSYENSWIRDGAIISAALLRTSYSDLAKEYVGWVAERQHPDGEIPCIVNAKTGKLVDYAKNWREYDASGEFVFAVADCYRFTKDNDLLKLTFPAVENTLKYLKALRATMLDSKYRGTPSYGILPAGESHEGYLNNPQQSLYDDFWALKGWSDAQMLAGYADRSDLIPWMKKEEKDFRKCLLDDIKLLQSQKNFNYIPASIGLIEFDIISLSILLFPTFEYHNLDRKQIEYMINRYYNNEFLPKMKRGDSATPSPYETRAITTLLILGERDKALSMIRYMLNHTRPPEWKHWAEVIPLDREAPLYLGDMPHTWISAIFINAVRILFVFEENGKIILGSGIDGKWLSDNNGVSVENFPTYFGNISYTVKKNNGNLSIKIRGNAEPEKGFEFRLPFPEKDIREVKINNKANNRFSKDSPRLGLGGACKIYFDKLPADIEVRY